MCGSHHTHQNIKGLTAGNFSDGLSRGGELCPEYEFAAVKLQVKTTDYDRMKEGQMSKMTMRELLAPLVGMRKLQRKPVGNEFHSEYVKYEGLG